jgi:hypothetical protein
VTTTLVCPACATRLDAAGPEAQVLEVGEKVERVRTTLPLGAAAKFNHREYRILGAMVRADDEGTEWTEYLLHNPQGGFFWLVEAEEWWRADVMHDWPVWEANGSSPPVLDRVTYGKLYDYPATVRWAAGAFNWRVQAGDVVQVSEFEHGQTRIAAERNADEMTWSRSTRVAFDQVKAWFGTNVRAGSGAPRAGAGAGKQPGIRGFMLALLFFNIFPAMLHPSSLIYPLIGALAIYLPARMMGGLDEDSQ